MCYEMLPNYSDETAIVCFPLICFFCKTIVIAMNIKMQNV